MRDSTIQSIIKEIKSIKTSLKGEITDSQAFAIMYITRDAGYGCSLEENGFLQLIFGDDMVHNLSKANAFRFIEYFGEKVDGKWYVNKDRLGDFWLLYHEMMKLDGQPMMFKEDKW